MVEFYHHVSDVEDNYHAANAVNNLIQYPVTSGPAIHRGWPRMSLRSISDDANQEQETIIRMMALHGVWLPPPSLHGTWSWTLTDAHLRPSQQIMPHNSYNKYVQSYWASEELKDNSEFLQHVNRINGFIIPWCVKTADDGCCFYCFSVLRKIGGEWIFLGGVDGCPVRSIDADHIVNFFYTTEGREKMRELAQTPFPSEHRVDYWYGSKNRPQVAILPKVDLTGDNDPKKIHFSEVGWDLSHDVNWDLNTGESPKKKKTKLDLLKKKHRVLVYDTELVKPLTLDS